MTVRSVTAVSYDDRLIAVRSRLTSPKMVMTSVLAAKVYDDPR